MTKQKIRSELQHKIRTGSYLRKYNRHGPARNNKREIIFV